MKLLEDFIFEMARTELFKVKDLIKAGKLKDAAEKYIEIGGSPAGVMKTVNSYLRKNPNENSLVFRQFAAEVVKLGREKGIKNPKATSHNTTQTAKLKTGETIKFKVGHAAEERNKQVLKRIEKVEQDIKKEMEALASGEDTKLKWVAQEILKDVSSKDFPEVVSVLQSFVKTGENKAKAISIMKKVVNDGMKNIIKLKSLVSNYKSIKPTPEAEKKLQKIYQKIRRIK